MISTATRIEDLTLSVRQEIHVRASLDATFAALLEQLGPYNDTPDHGPMPMKLEAVARRSLVPGVSGRQRPFLGTCASH